MAVPGGLARAGRLRPTGDLGFKKLLASEGHKAVTRGFVADFFGIEASLDEIRIQNPYSIHPVDLSAVICHGDGTV
ncbi:MAG: hypothetical protein LBG60_01260 [Bifidobacteriaceae bacterium]|jgi:hypothetical protein|nr:hypothetical protein [Bifidobacteriaceae bacterium]